MLLDKLYYQQSELGNGIMEELIRKVVTYCIYKYIDYSTGSERVFLKCSENVFACEEVAHGQHTIFTDVAEAFRFCSLLNVELGENTNYYICINTIPPGTYFNDIDIYYQSEYLNRYYAFETKKINMLKNNPNACYILGNSSTNSEHKDIFIRFTYSKCANALFKDSTIFFNEDIARAVIDTYFPKGSADQYKIVNRNEIILSTETPDLKEVVSSVYQGNETDWMCREFNTAIPSKSTVVAEDGILVSKQFLEKSVFRTYDQINTLKKNIKQVINTSVELIRHSHITLEDFITEIVIQHNKLNSVPDSEFTNQISIAKVESEIDVKDALRQFRMDLSEGRFNGETMNDFMLRKNGSNTPIKDNSDSDPLVISDRSVKEILVKGTTYFNINRQVYNDINSLGISTKEQVVVCEYNGTYMLVKYRRKHGFETVPNHKASLFTLAAAEAVALYLNNTSNGTYSVMTLAKFLIDNK